MGPRAKQEKAYDRVASELRDRILSRLIEPGQQLPTENELIREFSVSRITVRRALEILEEEHLIHRRQGKGSFVSPNPIRRIPLLIDYARSVRTHAPKLRRELLVWKWTRPPEDIREQLKLRAQEQVFYCERVDILDGRPVAFDRAYISPSFARELSEEDLAAVDFNEMWEKKSGFKISTCTQIVDAVAADSSVADRLGLEVGAPVLQGTERYFTRSKRPTGIFVNFYHPDYISLVSQFNWGG
jgi:DNA-binding GntR family transcriptional regulator